MTIMESRLEVTLVPSKTLALAQFWLLVSLFLLSAMLPVLLWAKSLLLLIIISVALAWLREWRSAGAEVLIFYPSINQCIVGDGLRCQLRAEQFVSRSLIILYLQTNYGKRISRAIPRDSLTENQHRLLRQLLMLRRADHDEQSHPDRQS